LWETTLLFWIFFSLIAGCALFQLVLELMNWSWMKQHQGRVPKELGDAVDPAKAGNIEAYSRAKIILGLWGDLVGKALFLGMLLFDGFAWLSGMVTDFGFNVIFTGLCFFGIMGLVGSILSLPFDWYSTFRIEERFGFNRTGYGLWIVDLVKGLVLSVIMGGVLLSVVLLLLYHGGTWWWLICWGTVFSFTLLISVIFPVLIAPLFNKFTPLEEGEFRDKVDSLMDRAGIRSKGVFVMDAKKRSTHTNAYFTGLGKAKRIVFYDTLLEKHTPEEGLAVLAHETGHWKKKHVLKSLILSQALTLGLFALTGWLVGWQALYGAFGFAEVTPYAGLFLVTLVYSPVMFFLNPFMSLLSRRHEYEADRFTGKEMGLGEPLCSMLVKSTVDNLSNLNPHPWYVRFYYSHPTVVQRIRRLKDGRDDSLY
jgi:STE24 endopeptidase